MATKAEAAAPQQPVNVDQQTLVDMMQTAVSTAVKAALQEARNPTPSDAEVAKAERWRNFWREQNNAARQQKEFEEVQCGHLRPEDGRSLLHWSNPSFPVGAEEGHCSRCSFQVRNYDAKHLLSADNEDYKVYAYWKRLPTGPRIG